ncbi:heterocyst frequency control protein PatD [Leptolyngbya sp. O-77]|uniref:heterocyst frequency control protein PatD n=1 Tax=Leptolyngbya sp. O-77 TaxID=1080068 RepID=UPI00074D4AD9|nr:heterocyst frequency control protein PatD [Leptolyngbya sp. O-77]BAU41375.1 hypothetical protein O77CONTIG1_01184 [Leptolyngbya sp. O-77]
MALSEWETYRPVYEALRSLSCSMLAQVSGEGAAPTGVADLRSLFNRLQTQFQQQILTLDLSGLDGTIAAQVSALHTEMAKQLRLLSMDLLFLQTARQPETTRQRTEQMGDRLRLLMRYCDAVLGEEA